MTDRGAPPAAVPMAVGGDPLAAIAEQRLPFLFRGRASLLFALLGPRLHPWLHALERRRVPASLLLDADDPVPTITPWQVRFCPARVTGGESMLIVGERVYHLVSALPEEAPRLIAADDLSPERERQRFAREWEEAADHLPTLPYLKSRQPQLRPRDYYRGTWRPAPEHLERIRRRGLPGYLLNLDQVASNYRRFAAALPGYTVHYSIKSNPDHRVLTTLHALGAHFEAVSFAEIELALAAGADAGRLLFSAPVKRREDIRRARRAGVPTFVADCAGEIDKLAAEAPGCRLLLRLRSNDRGAQVKLSSKYGAEAEAILPLLRHAQARGLEPYGLTFQVGGQNELPDSWSQLQEVVHELFDQAAAIGIPLTLVNVGGGFPMNMHPEVPQIERIGEALSAGRRPQLRYCAEPGRIIVGDAGLLACPVITVSQRADGCWLYVDASIFGALFMMGVHRFNYPITSDHSHLDVMSYHIASLSCDGEDIIARDRLLPVGIAEGHLLLFHLVGAYSVPVFDVPYAGLSPTEIHYLP
ncbi:type III PLP-dependent enzyme domain-containing protein [Endothiovibrio diazotrophicus]